MQIADEKNDIDQLVHNQLLSEAMKKLTDAQRNIIKTVFFEDKTMQSYCKKYGITKQSGYVHKERALKKNKTNLSKLNTSVLLPVQQDVFYFYAGIKKSIVK